MLIIGKTWLKTVWSGKFSGKSKKDVGVRPVVRTIFVLCSSLMLNKFGAFTAGRELCGRRWF